MNENNHWSISTSQAIQYDIISDDDLLSPDNPLLLSVGRGSRRIAIIDEHVLQHHGNRIRQYFHANEVELNIIKTPAGEENKDFSQYHKTLTKLDQFNIIRRGEPIIAIGGGVLTDVAAFVASTYRRGIPHIKIPTTLMGYIDAAIGIKNGINFNGNKNRIGSFAQPLAVFLDRSFLTTLPQRHVINGVGEIIKLAIIKDPELFHLLEKSGQDSIAQHFQNPEGLIILRRAIESMISELEPNLFEDNLDRIVDFGHTFAYAMEMQTNADLLHGEAVVIDMALSCIIAHQRHILSTQNVNRIMKLILNFGFRLFPDFISTEILWQSVMERTDHRDGQQRIPLPQDIGNHVFANDINKKEIDHALNTLITQTQETAHV